MDQLIRKFLKEHALFKEYANDEFLTSLASSMQPRMFVDGAYIIRKGEIGKAMFFNLKGLVEVISEDGETVACLLEEGSFFGEIGLLYSVPRTVSCRSRGKSVILVLTKDALDKALKPYPLIEKSIALKAEERYSTHLKKKASMVNESFGEEFSLVITQTELRMVSIFKDADKDFLHRLTLALKPMQFYQDQTIIKKGDLANEMFFLVKGTVHVVDEYGTRVFAIFEPGSFFGEIGVMMNNMRRTATLKCASGFALIFKCEKEDVDKILEDYPSTKKELEAEMSRRYEYIKAREQSAGGNVATDTDSIREKLKKVTLFSKASISFLHDLALKVTVKRNSPGEIIVKQGDEAHSMFFVIDGTVEVISADGGQIYATMTIDGYFGEVSLFFDQHRTATVRAKTETTLLELGQAVLNETFLAYPELKKSIAMVAAENYKAYRKRANLGSGKLSFEATAENLRKISIFKSADPAFLRDLAARTTVQTLQKGQIILKQGEESNEIFLVVEGEVEILSGDLQTIYDMIGSGGFFGEVGILHGWKRMATVRAFSPTVVLIVITRDTLKHTLEAIPESVEAITIACEERIQKAKSRNESHLFENTEAKLLIDIKPKSVQPVGLVHVNESRSRSNSYKKNRNELLDSLRSRNSLVIRSKSMQDSRSSVSANQFSNSTSITNILQCTAEGLFILLKKVPLNEKVKLRCTCSYLNEQLLEPVFWTELDLNPIKSRLTTTIYLEFIKIAGPTLISINLSVCDIIADEDIEQLCANCECLENLNISRCWKLTDKSLKAISSKLKKLKTLDMGFCSKFKGSGFEKHVLSNLITLNANHCKQLSDKNLEKLLQFTPNLTKISLNRCQRLTDFGLFLIARYCRDITVLSIEDCEQFSDRCVKWLGSSCLKLQNLNLTFCRGFSLIGFQALAASSLNLTTLTLTHCGAVNDSVIKELRTLMKSLKRLYLRSCHKITDSSACHIARNAPQLEILDIRGCIFTNPQSFKMMFESLGRTTTIIYDKDLESQGIKRPGYPNKPKLQELSLSDIFLSYPKCKTVVEGVHSSSGDLNIRGFLKSKLKKMKKEISK